MGKQPIIYGDGEQKRAFSYVTDCVDPLIEITKREENAGEVINIGPDEDFVTINHLAEEIADILDFDLDSIYKPNAPTEKKDITASADKARELLDYQTTVDLRKGLEEMVKWVKNEGANELDYCIDIEVTDKHTPDKWENELI